MADMREQGYRITLWQTPEIGEGNKLLEMAKEKRYLAPPKPGREMILSVYLCITRRCGG